MSLYSCIYIWPFYESVVDGHCSKPVSSGAPQGFVVLPTIFLLFISDSCVDSTLHFLTSYARHFSQQYINNSRQDATESITCDLFYNFEQDKVKLVIFNASKTQFLHLSIRHDHPDNYPLFFITFNWLPLLHIHGLSINKDFN